MKTDTEKPAAIAVAEPDEGALDAVEVDPFTGLHDPETFKPGHDPLRALDERLAGSLDAEELKADLLYGIASKRARRKYD